MAVSPLPYPAVRRRLAAWPVAIALGAASTPARGDDARARAEALFREAIALIDAGKAAEACPKLEESERLDAGIGTEFRLYDCYERVGKTASAWSGFVALAAKVNKPEQVRKARARADALEPSLARIRITVPAPVAAVLGLRIERDGAPVERSQWDAAVPVDPGGHRVRAIVDGRSPWETRVDAKPGAVATVEVEAPRAAEPSRARTAAIALVGVGLAGVVVGGVLGVMAGQTWSTAKSLCPGLVDCSREAHDRSVEAGSLALGSTVTFVASAAVVAAGVVVWLTVPRPKRAALYVAPAMDGSVRIGGTF